MNLHAYSRKVILLMLFLWLPCYTIYAQEGPVAPNDSIDREDVDFLLGKKRKNYAGLRAGGLIPSFYRAEGIPSPKVDPAYWNWHAGLVFDMFTRRYYNARLEVSYVNKGAQETFKDDATEIRSKTRLGYTQITAYPLVIKSGLTAVNPYLGIGGYYAYRVAGSVRTSVNQSPYTSNPDVLKVLDQKVDYGLSVSAGFYLRRFPLFEVRYEAGLPNVSGTERLRNRAVVISLSI